MNKLLEAAIEYAEAGIAVFPLAPRNKNPLTDNGYKNATTDLDVIRTWWAQTPNANIGIPVGKAFGIEGLDIDFKDGCDINFPSKLPPTVIVRTPTGGMHAYFKYAGIKNGKKLELGVTVRSDGYYFVGVPSTHPDVDGEYAYEGRGLIDGELAQSPEWFRTCEAFKKKHVEDIRIGHRHQTLNDKAVYYRKRGKDKDFVLKKLVDINSKFIDGKKPYEELTKIVEWAFDTVTDLDEDPQKKMTEEEIELLGKGILDIRFKLITNEEASIIFNIKNIDKKEVIVCNNEEYILRRLRKNIIEKIGMTATENFVHKVFVSWKLSTETIQQPLPFSWKSQDEWTFKKLDFEPCVGKFDAWQEFLLRLSSPEDFMAFVWSIFEIESRSRQYLYLYDPAGQGGKSTVINVLGEVFGNSYAAINNSFVHNGASRWLLGNLFGKRLVGWPDCKNTKFCMSELLRNITSGDDVTVEFKGKQPFTTRMYVKFIMASNHEPSITGGGADISRLIRIDVKENKDSKNDPQWKDRLRSELPYFLYECKYWYDKKCANHGNIKLEKGTGELAIDSTADVEARYEAIAERYIVFDPTLETTTHEWIQLCHQEKLNDMQIGNFKDYLRQNHSIHVKRPGGPGPRQRVLRGMKVYPLESIDTVKQKRTLVLGLTTGRSVDVDA